MRARDLLSRLVQADMEASQRKEMASEGRQHARQATSFERMRARNLLVYLSLSLPLRRARNLLSLSRLVQADMEASQRKEMASEGRQHSRQTTSAGM